MSKELDPGAWPRRPGPGGLGQENWAEKYRDVQMKGQRKIARETDGQITPAFRRTLPLWRCLSKNDSFHCKMYYLLY